MNLREELLTASAKDGGVNIRPLFLFILNEVNIKKRSLIKKLILTFVILILAFTYELPVTGANCVVAFLALAFFTVFLAKALTVNSICRATTYQYGKYDRAMQMGKVDINYLVDSYIKLVTTLIYKTNTTHSAIRRILRAQSSEELQKTMS